MKHYFHISVRVFSEAISFWIGRSNREDGPCQYDQSPSNPFRVWIKQKGRRRVNLCLLRLDYLSSPAFPILAFLVFGSSNSDQELPHRTSPQAPHSFFSRCWTLTETYTIGFPVPQAFALGLNYSTGFSDSPI